MNRSRARKVTIDPVVPRQITRDEFARISDLLHRRTGILLAPGKETLVMGRLDKRLRQLGVGTYGEYLRLLHTTGDELGVAIDALTTNETYFFREPQHFDFLRAVVAPEARGSRPLRVWSAAGSTGEEAYTVAMVLADAMPGRPWEVVATDISTGVLRTAKQGVYPLTAAARIPDALLRKYCRRGRDEYDGLMAVSRDLRNRVRFMRANLLDDLTGLGRFDVIMLRNVMIYFDTDTKITLVRRLADMLVPGGHLVVSHSESLHGIAPQTVRMTQPSIYQRVRTDDE
ncbi:CheR family methyltransferase [Virgisporangium aurantiacum]|uniref:protein-glutamate O-methyltransferase n=1 Tax=Virgisporangium aurantiacum TaxID=175570 RepID=A0A8J3Z1G1_9ACTN|nr:protein-glutamate O-methyltransferase CheR [Virgisporangium aurantiacum]GIJ53348.1 chemotaxis protein methyltransferase [Virgisporangium aurantiacum]